MLVFQPQSKKKKQKASKSDQSSTSSIVAKPDYSAENTNKPLTEISMPMRWNRLDLGLGVPTGSSMTADGMQSAHVSEQYLNCDIKNNFEGKSDAIDTLDTVSLSDTVYYTFSSITKKNDILNWNDLVKNAKNVLKNGDRLSIEIDIKTHIDSNCIKYINSFLKSIGTRNFAEISSLSHDLQNQTNERMKELLLSYKDNTNYQYMQHIMECSIENGMFSIKLNLDYDRYILNASDSMYQRFKNKLSNELSKGLGIDISLIIYKRMVRGSIWCWFRIVGDYLSLAFSLISRPFINKFVIDGERDNDENKFVVNDKVMIMYRNREYEGEVICVEKITKHSRDTYNVTVRYLNYNFLWSDTETLDAKSNRIRLKQPGDIEDAGRIDGEIEGSKDKLKMTLKWIKPSVNQSYAI